MLMPSLCRALPALLFLLGPAVFAHLEDAPPAKPFPENLAHAPRPLPDRVVLTWAGNPATTQAVTWRTDESVAQAVAEIALANENGRDLRGTRVAASMENFTSDLGPAHYHSVEFVDLLPDTLYAYRVGDGVNWSEWFHFRTASREAKPFTFVYFGDAQVDIKAHWSRVFREAFREAPRAAFTLHAGDLINRAQRDAEWGEWFGAPAWVNGTIPVVPAAGNHEYFKETTDGPRLLSRHWRTQFTLPMHGPAGLEETCYFFDYQGARIVVLNSNERQAEQVAWLCEVLNRDPQRWTILTFHHPIFSPAPDRDNAKLRDLWKPVFDEFKVDLVLTGHDHSYARSGVVGTQNVPVGFGQVYEPAIGTVYVVSVSGPKMYAATAKWAVRSAEDTQLFQVITIDGDELRYEARTATNRIYDTFTLTKRPGRPNELREALPPEIHRPAEAAK
jgi:3',5'-cyclic AMP phosphodiesterase CpdA